MKKLMNVTLLLILVISTKAQSQAYYQDNDNRQNRFNNANSSLTIGSSSINKEYIVNVNNRFSYLLNGNNANTTIRNLGTGLQYIEVIRVRNNVFGQQRRELLYSGNVQLKPGFETMIQIDMFDRVNVQERQVFFNNGNNGGGWHNGNGNGCGNNNGYGWGQRHQKRNKGGRRDW